ncbi:hypothetical protein M0804_011807 [Polistes exclamans]|nr:hypothetical protein M0804_011807 [Polistes exclamans]
MGKLGIDDDGTLPWGGLFQEDPVDPYHPSKTREFRGVHPPPPPPPATAAAASPNVAFKAPSRRVGKRDHHLIIGSHGYYMDACMRTDPIGLKLFEDLPRNTSYPSTNKVCYSVKPPPVPPPLYNHGGSTPWELRLCISYRQLRILYSFIVPVKHLTQYTIGDTHMLTDN